MAKETTNSEIDVTIDPKEIETKFQEIAKVSEVTPTIDVTGLHTIANKAKALQDIDITNDEKMAEVTAVRKELAEARKQTVDFVEPAREKLYKVYKGTLQVKNILLDIITPEEDRLKAIEKERKELDTRNARVALLPMRQEALAALKDGVEVTDEFILDMDNDQFVTYLNERTTAKNEADRIALEAEKTRLAREAEDRKIAEEAATKERQRIEAEQRAQEEARIAKAAEEKVAAEKAAQKLIDDAKADAERIAKEAEDARIAKEAKEKEDARLAEEERQRIEAEQRADTKYQNFLKENDYSEETDIINRDGSTVTIYRKVATITI